jgi:hypothetical protein
MPETTADAKIKTTAARAVGAQTLMYMKGHIMLYLGALDGVPYAIHDVWAYREHINGQDVPKVINRVAVTELTLGAGSKKGSLAERLKSLRAVE